MFVTAACVSLDLKEGTPVLSCEDYTLPADVETGIVSSRIEVASNQSWTARIDGICNWARISDSEHINPSDVSDNGYFTIELDNNNGYEPRFFEVVITGKDLEKTVRITQLAKKNRIRVREPLSQTLPAEPEQQKITILSNTEWEIVADSTKCTLSTAKGYGDKEIDIAFAPNYSIDTTGTVSILIACEDADTVRMSYSLTRNIPFVRVDEEDTEISILPIDTTATITFHTNDSWKAEILSSSIENLRADSMAGGAGIINLGLHFGRNKSETIREATIRISHENRPEIFKDIKLTQRKGTALFLDFSTGVSKVPLKPATVDDPPLKEHVTDGIAHNYIFNFDGEEYYFTLQFPVEYYYYISGKCFYSRKGYFMLPSIDGKRLVEVQVVPATSKRYSVCEDSTGLTYLDGGLIFTTTAGVPAKWILKNTSESASYFLYFHDNGMQTKSMTFIYE